MSQDHPSIGELLRTVREFIDTSNKGRIERLSPRRGQVICRTAPTPNPIA